MRLTCLTGEDAHLDRETDRSPPGPATGEIVLARLVDVVCPGRHDNIVVPHTALELLSLAVSPAVVPALVCPGQ